MMNRGPPDHPMPPRQNEQPQQRPSSAELYHRLQQALTNGFNGAAGAVSNHSAGINGQAYQSGAAGVALPGSRPSSAGNGTHSSTPAMPAEPAFDHTAELRRIATMWADHRDAAAAAASMGAGTSRPAPFAAQPPSSQQQRQQQQQQSQEEHPENEGSGDEDDSFDTYANYTAHKALYEAHQDLQPHPDPLVESASLAAVQLPDPVIDHTLHQDIATRRLSDAQLEAIVYASMKFNGPRLPDGRRRGYLCGDGAGVGKGRTIAGIIKEHWNRGGKYILWVSVSQDLRRDARRDLDDLAAQHIPIYEPKGSKHIPDFNFQGVVFVTYALLRTGIPPPPKDKKRGRSKPAAATKKGSRVDQLRSEAEASSAGGSFSPNGGVFCSDESENGEGGLFEGEGQEEEELNQNLFEIRNLPSTSRLAQIISWLGRGGENGSLCIFDESHRAKNLLNAKNGKPTQTARAVVHLQQALANAKVLYASATGASEPKNLAYMTRIWGYEKTFEMINLLDGKNVELKLSALELAAMSLKASGSYISRTLSYAGAEFELVKVAIQPSFRVMYDRSTMFWNLLFRIMSALKPKPRWSSLFWAANQRFFRSMLMAAKVPYCAQMALEAVQQQNMSVVIGLQSTGEAATDNALSYSAEDMDDFVSAPMQVLNQFLTNHFPDALANTNDLEVTGQLQALEYQVWQAAQQWKDMVSATDFTGNGAMERDDITIEAVPSPDALNVMQGGLVNMEQHLNDAQIAHLGQIVSLEERDEQNAAAADGRERMVDREGRHRRAHSGAASKVANSKKCRERILHFLSLAESGGIGALNNNRFYTADLEDEDVGKGPGPSRFAKNQLVDSSDDDEDVKTRPASAGAARPQFASTVDENGTLCIDLTGDTDEDEPQLKPQSRPTSAAGASKKLPAPAVARPRVPRPDELASINCLMCNNPADVAMAKCISCNGWVHAACVGKTDVPANFICYFCHFERPTSAQAAAAIVKSEPAASDDFALLGDADDSAEYLSDASLACKSVVQLKLLLRSIDQRIKDSERELERIDIDFASDEEEEELTLNYSGGSGSGNRMRRSKASKQRLAQQAAAVKTEPPTQPLMSPPTAMPVKRATYLTPDHLTNLPDYRPAVNTHPDRMDEIPDTLPNNSDAPPTGAVVFQFSPRLARMKKWLLTIVRSGLELPPNPLDQLISLMGGESKVAELTGRKSYLNKDGAGNMVMKTRGEGEGPAKELNLREKDKFMKGDKRIAIISEAASTGISLQADLRVRSSIYRRTHITLELPWSADAAVQQFGRSHRANQASAPLYKILVTECGGESRFASAAAKRLASLGALLRGDRKAVGAGTELKEFDIDTNAGKDALKKVLNCMLGLQEALLPSVKIPEMPAELVSSTDGSNLRSVEHNPFFKHFTKRFVDMGIFNGDPGYPLGVKMPSKNTPKVATFLNRLLGLPMVEQNLLFEFFSSMLDAVIRVHRSEGKLDAGIANIPARSLSKESDTVVRIVDGAPLRRIDVLADQGMSFEEALQELEEAKERVNALNVHRNHLSGFYINNASRSLNGHRVQYICLATEVVDAAAAQGLLRAIKYRIHRPWGHEKVDIFSEEDMRDKGYTFVRDQKQAKEIWEAWFNFTEHRCGHGDNCNYAGEGPCTFMCRNKKIPILCGGVLPVWPRLLLLRDCSQWAKKKVNADGKLTPQPLRIRRAVVKDPNNVAANDEPMVGIAAICPEEMDFFVNNLDPAEAGVDVVQQYRGTNYADPNRVRGLNEGADPFYRRPSNNNNGSRGGGSSSGGGGYSKRPKKFR